MASAAVLGLAGGGSEVDLVGFGCIVAACAAWGIDNNLTQRLSGRDPFAVVRAKAAVAAVVNLGVAVIVSSPWPSGRILLAALVVGGASYGLRLVRAGRDSHRSVDLFPDSTQEGGPRGLPSGELRADRFDKSEVCDDRPIYLNSPVCYFADPVLPCQGYLLVPLSV